MWLDQRNQHPQGHRLIRYNQEALATGLLAFPGKSGVGEGHLFHQGSTAQFVRGRYFTSSRILFQSTSKD
jgi:hypothetical protein